LAGALFAGGCVVSAVCVDSGYAVFRIGPSAQVRRRALALDAWFSD